jgi:hypothetical protein
MTTAFAGTASGELAAEELEPKASGGGAVGLGTLEAAVAGNDSALKRCLGSDSAAPAGI